ncbi:MAG: hypothetical protein H6765_03440 [Candidatus Peribacteria bacterium]|nr:MAG: hypothetical protein H6765_03440 [Candidatus Peribacteria bacterium]
MMASQKDIPADHIVLEGVRTHNLKDISVHFPKNQITTITGVSGSGKSSLAFDTIYKEGQFRYIESLSSYLRQFFSLGTRPELDYSAGLSPAIAIEQNKRTGNSRSTVGTLTEIDDYLRLLLAKLGEVFCHTCGTPLRPKNTDQIIADIKIKFMDQKVYLLQEIGTFADEASLSKYIRRNRKQVDQGGGMTRFLVALEYVAETNIHGELVEYFYLEDPKIPKEMFSVKLYGIFDRVTINQSTLNRLKDDTIKMLARADKFGVMLAEPEEDKKQKKKTAEKKSDLEVILLHGKDTNPSEKRYPRLGEELKKFGIKYTAPKLPHANNPKIKAWKEHLTKLKPGKDTILV